MHSHDYSTCAWTCVEGCGALEETTIGAENKDGAHQTHHIPTHAYTTYGQHCLGGAHTQK